MVPDPGRSVEVEVVEVVRPGEEDLNAPALEGGLEVLELDPQPETTAPATTSATVAARTDQRVPGPAVMDRG